jgi:hypothetical protein
MITASRRGEAGEGAWPAAHLLVARLHIADRQPRQHGHHHKRLNGHEHQAQKHGDGDVGQEGREISVLGSPDAASRAGCGG